MTFDEILAQVIELLQRERRVSYRSLKRRFNLDDEYIEDLKAELIHAKRLASDEDGTVLVWGNSLTSSVQSLGSEEQGRTPSVQTLNPRHQTLDSAASRRQLTVMFCDLVGSTALSAQLDPEDLREVVQAYQRTCSEVIHHHEGYLAQYLGDGLLVYFGYPAAHEDDARRAVRAGLEIIQALHIEVLSLLGVKEFLQVRIGIHTGLVVVGEIGSNEKRELLALGETPNLAARIQGLAEPNTVIVSAATQRLIDGQFECQPFGSHLVKGIDVPIAVYHVQSERQNIALLAGKTTFTPLVGREQEVGLLFDRWEQVKEGHGQVVLLSGEPGIGKSRLAYTLKEHVANERYLLIESLCSPYHQHSALYPLIEFLQRVLLPTRQETDGEKVEKLERALALYDMQETVPLFTALLSLPTPSHYLPLNLTPQKQKERTLQAAVQWLIAQAEWQATVSVWEDLHWADPSSLEFLTLLVEQIPTSKLLLVLTFRPEFTPPWKLRSHVTQLTLNRLGKRHVEAMIEKVAEGKTLPAEFIEQIRTKTDGVPLFVEELTKSVIEAGIAVGAQHAAPLPFSIPATLQEALLARLDRLSGSRQIAQLGATLGREFSYELLHTVAPTSETDLQVALAQLVEAEILYQRGVGQQSRYFFKHALIQDTAYQSLLKSTRQQYHQQIAQVLEEQFLETKETQPELLAHHYTEARITAQAISYWQRAGQQAIERSANIEAVSHLIKGLELVSDLLNTEERIQQELVLQVTLGPALMAVKGYAAPEVENAYVRALELCQQLGDPPQLLPVLVASWVIYIQRGDLQRAHELARQCITIAEHGQDSALLLPHIVLGITLFFLGNFPSARLHLEQGAASYEAPQHHSLAFLYYGLDPGVFCLSWLALTLWNLGYSDNAVQRSREALTLARGLSHPFSSAFALNWSAWLHHLRQEKEEVWKQGQAAVDLSTEQGFPFFLAWGSVIRGSALANRDHVAEGIQQVHQGLAGMRATGAELWRPYHLILLVETYGKAGQIAEQISTLDEAVDIEKRTGIRFVEAELHRLKGEILLAQEGKEQEAKKETAPRLLTSDPQGEAKGCFLKAIEVARKQQAKSLELRAVMSLVRLRQHQAQAHASPTTQHEVRIRLEESHKMLAEIYNWFTEGFDTKDLQEAKELLEELTEDKL